MRRTMLSATPAMRRISSSPSWLTVSYARAISTKRAHVSSFIAARRRRVSKTRKMLFSVDRRCEKPACSGPMMPALTQ